LLKDLKLLKEFRVKLEDILNEHIVRIVPLSTSHNSNFKVISKKKNYFCKLNSHPTLSLLNESKQIEIFQKYIRTPKLIYSDESILITNWITYQENPNTQSLLGEMLAEIHKIKSCFFGFNFDNNIGLTFQNNAVGKEVDNWFHFYWKYRFIYQVELAYINNHIDKTFLKKLFSTEGRFRKFLDLDFTPSLLHGDLWSGNFCESKNGPYMIDFAAYYGHREADFSLTYMFGGFSDEFYKSYNKIYPIDEGFKERKPIYMIYHYLNHLNLFGRSYLDGVLNCYQKIIN